MREPQLAQHRLFLGLMGLHARQDVIERAQRRDDEWRPLVQHHALSSVTHGSVGNLGPRRKALPRKRVQNLSRPDHRDVSGLADPQDLLLNFGQPFEAALDGQIAPRDHDPRTWQFHRRHQDVGQLLKPAPGLDLEDDRRRTHAQLREVRVQRLEIAGRA
jgi:hypothetical protein